MKARGAALQGALALGGLIGAYAAWQREPESGAEEVVVLDLGKSDLEEVRFEDGPRFVVLKRQRDLSESPVWMTTGTRPVPPAAAPDGGGAARDGGALADAGTAPDAGTRPDAGAPPAPKPMEREVKANEQAERLLERFTPLRASRALGVLGPDKLKELGLEGSHRKLEVLARGTPHDFTVSQALSAPYLLDTQSGRVYLVGASLISDLDSASSRLVERRLHTFKPSELDTTSVRLGDKRRELVQTLSDTGLVAKVTSKGSDKPDDFAKSWLEKVWRLIPTEILGKGEALPGSPPVLLRLDYLSRNQVKGWVELARVGGELYARTEYTAGWVKVHGSPDELLAEADKVVSGK